MTEVGDDTFSLSDETLAAKPHVFTMELDGRRVWVKRRRPDKTPFARWLQRLAYKITGLLLVLPPESRREDSVAFETRKLRRMAGAGVRVPEVLHAGRKYFVMADAGPTLEAVLAADPEAAPELVAAAARELRSLHDKGFAHGGAQIKNITVSSGTINFIDFEEKIPDKHVAQFQIRDLFLFLLSLERAGHDPDIAVVCRDYGGDRRAEVLDAVRKAMLQLRFLRFFELGLFSYWSMRDIRCLVRLVRKAERLECAPETQ